MARIAIQPLAARHLAASVRRAGEEASNVRERVAAILAEADEAAPVMERNLDDVARFSALLASDIEWRVDAMVAIDGSFSPLTALLQGDLPATEGQAQRVVLAAELERTYGATRIEIELALAATTAALAAGGGDAEALRRREATLREFLQDPNRQFLEFDNTGDGRVVEAFGDLATAAHVSWFVPGITNTLDNFSVATAGHARRIYDEAARLNGGGGVATIAWLGYDTPGHPDAVSRAAAGEGGHALRDHIAGLGLAGDVTTTVVAHSYGSLVTGTALQQGLDVDNVVAIGSPGMGAEHVDDFRLPEGTDFYAAGAPLDPVSYSEWHGADPADPRFGGTRLATGEGEEGIVSGHSAYTMQRSTSLRNLALITLDRDAQVHAASPTPIEQLIAAPDHVQRAGGAALETVDRGIDRGQDAVRGVETHLNELLDGAQEQVAESNEGIPVAEQVAGAGNAVVDGIQQVDGASSEVLHSAVDGIQIVGRGGALGYGMVVDDLQEKADKVNDVVQDAGEMLDHHVMEDLGEAVDDIEERLPWN